MFNLFNNQNNGKSVNDSKDLQNDNFKMAGVEKNKFHNKNIVMDVVTDFETLQKVRKDLVGEIDAIIQYDEHIYNTTNPLAKETWENIKKEEIIHVGELMALLNYLDPSQKEYFLKGWKEASDRINKKN